VADGTVNLMATATDVDGNVGSSAVSAVSVGNGAPAPKVTLAQLQTQIFTPICSVCHTGTGTGLPAVRFCTPGLLRIKPNDPANSYLIQKIEGAPGITGQRMPAGCPSTQPCLDQATIELVKTWVSQGALNN